MSHTVIVAFGAGREYEIHVHEAEANALTKSQARDWLSSEFERLECSPSNPMGKILVLDMVLNVAKYGGEEHFKAADEWARKFAAVTAVALARPAITVDIANFIVR